LPTEEKGLFQPRRGFTGQIYLPDCPVPDTYRSYEIE
jgi:hypothetical protein